MRPPTCLAEPAALSYSELVKQQQQAMGGAAASPGTAAVDGSRGELVLAYGSCLLRRFGHRLGSALWGVLETVYLQALEYRQDRWAQYCLRVLQRRWPESMRVQRLAGLAAEARGDWQQAILSYEDILEQQSHDTLTRKRIIAALRNQGRLGDCMRLLYSHLEEFGGDVEAWQELVVIFCGEGKYAEAAFCVEELLAQDACNPLFLCLYAELQFTLRSWRLCRQYAAQLLSAWPRDPRALWNLILSSREALEELGRLNVSGSSKRSSSSSSAGLPAQSAGALPAAAASSSVRAAGGSLHARAQQQQRQQQQRQQQQQKSSEQAKGNSEAAAAAVAGSAAGAGQQEEGSQEEPEEVVVTRLCLYALDRLDDVYAEAEEFHLPDEATRENGSSSSGSFRNRSACSGKQLPPGTYFLDPLFRAAAARLIAHHREFFLQQQRKLLPAVTAAALS